MKVCTDDPDTETFRLFNPSRSNASKMPEYAAAVALASVTMYVPGISPAREIGWISDECAGPRIKPFFGGRAADILL